jgi:hypothetical protein
LFRIANFRSDAALDAPDGGLRGARADAGDERKHVTVATLRKRGSRTTHAHHDHAVRIGMGKIALSVEPNRDARNAAFGSREISFDTLTCVREHGLSIAARQNDAVGVDADFHDRLLFGGVIRQESI